MVELTEAQLKRIEARALAATAGPWEAELDCFDPDTREIEACVTNQGVRILFTSGTDIEASDGGWKDARHSQALKDARFMAHSRTDVPALIAEIRRLQAQRGDSPPSSEAPPACP
jgi:hypothetical protein